MLSLFPIAVNCSHPGDGENTDQSSRQDQYPVGFNFTYDCQLGFRPVDSGLDEGGSLTLECLANQTWSTTPLVCEGEAVLISSSDYVHIILGL